MSELLDMEEISKATMQSENNITQQVEQANSIVETKEVDEIPKFIIKTLTEEERATHIFSRIDVIKEITKTQFNGTPELLQQLENAKNLEWSQITIDVRGKKEFIYLPTSNNQIHNIDGFDKSDISTLAYNFVDFAKTIDTTLPTDIDDRSVFILLPADIPHRAYADATNGVTPLTLKTIKYERTILAHEMAHIRVGGSRGILNNPSFYGYTEGAARYIERIVNYGQHPELLRLGLEGSKALLSVIDESEPSLSAIYKNASKSGARLEKYREYAYWYGDAAIDAIESTNELPEEFIKDFYAEVYSKSNAESYVKHAQNNTGKADLAVMELAMSNILKNKYLYNESQVQTAITQYKENLKQQLKSKLENQVKKFEPIDK